MLKKIFSDKKKDLKKETTVGLDKTATKPNKIKKFVEKKKKPTVKKVEKSTNAVVTNNIKPKKEEKAYVIPLGGLDEVGKNMTLVQYRDEIIIIDAGLTFPDDNLPGIDLVIPDYSYLQNNKEKIKGLLITHGHEDHIGGIPYFYQMLGHDKVNMYGGKLTLALAKTKFENPAVKGMSPKMREVKGRDKVKIGKYFEAEFVRVTHSIADAFAIVVRTPAGVILFSGDFKVDLTPVDGIGMDFQRFAAIGEEGVDLLLSDSTNAEVPGYTPSERKVGEAFVQEFARAKGRIVVAAFASHIHRLQQIVDVVHSTKRKLAIDGRSMIKVFDIATKLGYLNIPKNTLVSLKAIEKLPDHKAVILCTGTQGEPMAALSRIANRMHKHINVKEGDTVIISATPIPGNEKAVYNNINNLLKHDADVIFQKVAGIHVSGHGSQDEQKLLINLIKPKNFMPVHGEFKMLKAHKRSAMECGVPEENIVLANNGAKVMVSKSEVSIMGKVPSGATLVDGLGVGDVGNIVLRDRQLLAQDGIVIVALSINKKDGVVVSGPDIITRGFVYSKESESLIAETTGLINEALSKINNKKMKEWNQIKSAIRDCTSKHLYQKTNRNPVILPIIMEV